MATEEYRFNARHDLQVAHGQNDPGLYTRANELLQPYSKSHRHVVVIVDAEWDGSPGATAILKRLTDHLRATGWGEEKGAAIVIDPELENWVWQNSPHVCSALGFEGTYDVLRASVENRGFWTSTDNKPHRPKEAVEWVLQQTKKRRSSAIYQELASQVSIRNCTDPAFSRLRNTLRRWFPAPN